MNPKNRLRSSTFFGGGLPAIAFSLSGSALRPSVLTICPKNFNSWRPNLHFCGFNFNPAFESLTKTSSSPSSNSSNVFPGIIISS